MGEYTWAVIAIAFLALTFWFAHAPTPSIHGDIAVPTETHFHLWGTSDNADGSYQIRDNGTLVRAFHVRDNRVSELPHGPDAEGHHYATVYDRDLYLGKSGLDLGAWTGYGRLGEARHWQTGARYSPARFFYGTLAPDLAVSQDAAGIGITAFPPADYLGPFWSHLGLGVWYVAPFDGSNPGPVYGLSFSTR